MDIPGLPPGGTIGNAANSAPAGLPPGGTIGHSSPQVPPGLPPGGTLGQSTQTPQGLPPGGSFGPDLNAVHPVSGLPIWEHNATEEINNTPGARNDLSGDMRKQIMAKWMNAAHPMTEQFKQAINRDLTTGQRALEYT